MRRVTIASILADIGSDKLDLRRKGLAWVFVYTDYEKGIEKEFRVNQLNLHNLRHDVWVTIGQNFVDRLKADIEGGWL